MNIFTWIVFALINLVVLFLIDYDPRKAGKFDGFIIGIIGALSGSLVAYIAVRGVTPELVLTFFLILGIEAILMSVLVFTKSFRNLRI